MRFSGLLQLALDGALGAARSARAGARGGRGGGEASGALRPGSHVLYPTQVREAGGRKYLVAGPIHRSFWRTIEWRLLQPMAAGMARPLADVGCGDGEFGKALFRAVDLGVDGEAETIVHCDPAVYKKTALVDLRREMPRADGGEGADAGAGFATIFSNSTLEHIEGIDAVLKNLAAATAPGGRLVFTVPSSGLVRAFSNAFGRGYSGRLNEILGHHNLWTAAEWTSLLKAAGYAEVTTRGYMTDAAAAWFASLHLPPWPQLGRRASGQVWASQLPKFLDLVDVSLAEQEEARTACLLVEARK